MGCILTVDIGGTSAKSAAIYPNGRFERLKGFATGVCMTRKELEEALYSVIQSCLEEPDGIGISTLGIVDKRKKTVLGGVENLPCMQNFSATEYASRYLSGKPVSIVNDAAAAAMGEFWKGAARGQQNSLSVSFGTGIGGCLYLNGHPHEGATHRAGEIGYWDFKAPGEYWEVYGSAQAIVRTAQLALGVPDYDGVRFFRDLKQGNSQCKAIFSDWLEKTGSILANMLLLIDVPVIIVGGGISAVGQDLTTPLENAVRKHLPPTFQEKMQVLPAALGNDAALWGAAFERCCIDNSYGEIRVK